MTKRALPFPLHYRTGQRYVLVVTLNVDAWPGLELVNPAIGGHRNEVWFGHFRDRPVSVRQSCRSEASLAWELQLLCTLIKRGFLVPAPVACETGSLSSEGVVVQDWIDGHEPSSDDEWGLVADELMHLHATCADVAQRPGCMAVTDLTATSRSVDADMSAAPIEVAEVILGIFNSYRHIPVSLIHGDPNASNIRITNDGRVALLDWDESRVDVVWHDLSNLGIQVLSDVDHERAQRLSNAWETANAWVAEPEYAQRRYAALRNSLL
jgi:Ser/Thr protein kinase RdoA (MazF antagonist)